MRDLELYLSFKEGIGNQPTVKDLSGNGNDLILNNFKYNQSSGFTGSSLRLDGVDNYGVILPKNTSLFSYSAKGKTLEIHYKKTTPFSKLNSQGIFGFINSLPALDDGSGHNINAFRLGSYTDLSDTSSPKYDIMAQVNDLTLAKINTQAFPANYVHEVYVMDSTCVKCYRNGSYIGYVSLNSLPRSINTPLVVGALLNAQVPLDKSFIDMDLIAIRVYGKALTDDEVIHNFAYEKLYNS